MKSSKINFNIKSTVVFLICFMFCAATLLADTHDVFIESGIETWNEVKKLTASDSEADDLFGWSVAVGGDVAVVGARNNNGNTGAVYIFERNTGGSNNWGVVKKLTSSDAESGDLFGYSVAISDDLAVISAYGENSGGASAGAAYVFEQNLGGANAWGEVKKLTASDAGIADYFGYSVAVAGDVAVVGAQLEDADGNNAGAAYIIERNAGGINAWGEVKKLTASDSEGYERFGTSVAAAGDVVVVGAPYKAAGVPEVGAVYIFERNEGGANAWGEVKKLTGSNASINNRFGWSVAVASNVALIGTHHSDTAYVFGRNEGGINAWGEVMPVYSHEVNSGFGRSVSVAGDVAVVGSDNSGPVGFDTGAAYVFEKSIIPEPMIFWIFNFGFLIYLRKLFFN